MTASFLVLCITLFVILRKRFHINLISPGIAFLLPWIVMSSLLLVGAVEYDRIFSFQTWALICASVIAFSTGIVLVANTVGQQDVGRAQSERISVSRELRIFLVISSFLYAVSQGLAATQIAEAISSGTVSFEEVRGQHWESSKSGARSSVDFLVKLCRCSAVLSAANLAHNVRYGRRIETASSVAAIAGAITETFVLAGRFMGMFVLLVAVIGYLKTPGRSKSRRKRTKPLKTIAASLVGLGLTYFIFGVFPVLRNPNLPMALDLFLSFSHSARIAPWVYEVMETTGLSSIGVFAYGSSYLTIPIPKCTFFLETTDISEAYLLGAYNVPGPSRMWAAVSGGQPSWALMREKIALISTEAGYSPNPWATGVRDLVIDFGVVGAPIALALFGALVTYVDLRADTTADQLSLTAASILITSCLLFPFFSPFYVGPVFNSLVLLGVLRGARTFSFHLGAVTVTRPQRPRRR